MDRSVAEIAVATREQSAGILHIADAVSQIDAVTQGNAAAAEESAQAAEDLAAQSNALIEGVGELTRLICGDGNKTQKESASAPDTGVKNSLVNNPQTQGAKSGRLTVHTFQAEDETGIGKSRATHLNRSLARNGRREMGPFIDRNFPEEILHEAQSQLALKSSPANRQRSKA
jgi:hypothetical protein